MAMPSSPAVDIFENEQSVSSNSLGKPERQTDTNTIGKESQRLTLTFSIPTNCETKELTGEHCNFTACRTVVLESLKFIFSLTLLSDQYIQLLS